MLKSILILFAVLAPFGADDPSESGITERVDVQLVLLDVTVVDKRRDIVTGLTREDFVLLIDHRRVPIVSLDLACPDTPVAEPPAVDAGRTESEWEAPDIARKIIFAVDYRHLEQTQRVEVLESIRDAIKRLHRSREQVMVVALADFLRVELPLTTDGDAAVVTLERMENDISLWLPPFDHLHDGPTFEALGQLIDLLGTLDGEKVVVLFSNWPSSGFTYDDSFEKLTSRAARSRVAFYTVWARGLRPRGTSRNLARLAMETGGRFTERTSDFSLGYARAQRDSSCKYTIGFHDSGLDAERARRVDLRVERRGIRVFHHDLYAPADPDDARDALADAVLAWPERYASESVHVELLPLWPISRRRWTTAFAVEGSGVPDTQVRLRARLRRGNTRWSRTDETRMAPFSAAQTIRLRHGTYASSLTAVYPGEAGPRSAMSTVELSILVDEHGWWFADPLVLRAMGPGPVEAETLEGTALAGDPLRGRVPVLRGTADGDLLSMLNTVCRYGATPDPVKVVVEVAVAAGESAFFAVRRTLEFASGRGVRCESVDERLPALPPGAYSATVRIRPSGGAESVRRRDFEVLNAPAPLRP